MSVLFLTRHDNPVIQRESLLGEFRFLNMFSYASARHRYASLYFCCAIEDQDNELITLEIIHRYVELLDKYFGSVGVLPVLHIRSFCWNCGNACVCVCCEAKLN